MAGRGARLPAPLCRVAPTSPPVVHNSNQVPGATCELQGALRNIDGLVWSHSLPPNAAPGTWLEPHAAGEHYLLQAMSAQRAYWLLLMLPLTMGAVHHGGHIGHGPHMHTLRPHYTQPAKPSHRTTLPKAPHPTHPQSHPTHFPPPQNTRISFYFELLCNC